MKAVFYLRCSTEGQAVDGVSLEAQLAKLTAWAQLHDATILSTHTDAGISGTREDRPGLADAVAAACRERAALVVYSISRLSRSTSHTIALADTLARSGADLVSLTEQIDTTTAAGRMVFRLMGSLAEFERDLIAERTRSALALKKSRNERTGGVPFGFDLAPNGTDLVPNANQQEALALIAELRAAGLSLRDIAQTLTDRSIPTSKGNAKWTHTTIARIVTRAA